MEMITMRARRFLGVGAACLIALASVFAPAGPASAAAYPTFTYVSGLTPQGTKPTDANRMVLDVLLGSTANGAPVQMWRQNGLPQQNWTISRLGKDETGQYMYVLRNGNSSKCLDMATDGVIGDGTRVQQWSCSAYATDVPYNQRWYGSPVVTSGLTAPWIKLKSALRPDLCLDVAGYNGGNGARLQVFTCHGGWNQRFNVS
jgi:hypothetical protein